MIEKISGAPDIPLTQDKPKVNKKAEEEKKPASDIPSDTIVVKKDIKGITADAIKLTGEPDKKDDPKPWKIKNVNVHYGFMPFNDYNKSNLHIRQPGQNTDVVISGVEHEQRTSHTYLYGKPRFAPDEPQFDAGVDLKFNNNFGVGLNVKHNKIIIKDYNQDVHFKGTINGEYVDKVMPLNSFVEQYEVTKGNHQVSLTSNYALDLPAPKNQALTFNTKLGPSAIISYSRTSFKGQEPQYEGGLAPLSMVGYGGIFENSVKYELGKKLGNVSIEVAHGISYLNFSNVPVNHGTASNQIWANQFSINIGKTFGSVK